MDYDICRYNYLTHPIHSVTFNTPQSLPLPLLSPPFPPTNTVTTPSQLPSIFRSSSAQTSSSCGTQRLPQIGDFIFDINVDACISKKQGRWILFLPVDCFDYVNPLIVIEGMKFTGLKSYKYVSNPELSGTLQKIPITYNKYNININYETGAIETVPYNEIKSSFGSTLNRFNSLHRANHQNSLYHTLANFISSLQGDDDEEEEDYVSDNEPGNNEQVDHNTQVDDEDEDEDEKMVDSDDEDEDDQMVGSDDDDDDDDDNGDCVGEMYELD